MEPMFAVILIASVLVGVQHLAPAILMGMGLLLFQKQVKYLVKNMGDESGT